MLILSSAPFLAVLAEKLALGLLDVEACDFSLNLTTFEHMWRTLGVDLDEWSKKASAPKMKDLGLFLFVLNISAEAK